MKLVELHARHDIERALLYRVKLERLGVHSNMDRLGIYWDISGKLPAAQAGKSYKLVYLIANEVRKQFDFGNHTTFIPLSEEESKKFTTDFGYKYDLYGKLVELEAK